MGVFQERMEFWIALNNNFSKEVSICVEDCNSKPHPLSCSKKWNGVLDGVEISTVPDLDQLSELACKQERGRRS